MTAPPNSLWAATAPPPPPTAPLQESLRTDVVVIGAGVTGLSTAIHLAERGIGCVVLEAEAAGFGGSGRNSGHIIPTLGAGDPDALVARLGAERGERMVAFLRDSADLVFELIRRYQIECEAVQNGWAMPAHRPSRLKDIERRYEEWTRRQARARLLDAAETEALLGTRTYHGALMLPSGGHVNPLALAHGLAHAAVGLGVRLYTGAPALSLDRGADGGWRVRTPSGEVIADKLVVATNAYTGALVPKLARSLVRIINYQVSTHPLPAGERESVLPSDVSSSDTRRDLRPFRKDRAGRLVTGATLALPIAMDRRIRPWIERRIGQVFPQISDRRLEYVWNGRIAMTPNRLPRVHEIGPGAITAIAYNGRGMAIGMAMGAALADWAAGTPADQLPLPKLEIEPLPLASALGRWAQVALLWYRRLDTRD
ncbi:MAG: FAD-binding oxidoreductase [Alphaproteobacteria bacterium]|nr:FAD-binding oxidoreductase [Alphaproteobacteria bacterium]